ncbi:MAG: family 1 glycosylhydrolase [Gemmatimonadaceae bacterium]
MDAPRQRRDALQLWGGIECTVNRSGEHYIDQLELTGHAERDGDIDMLVSLGMRMMRYPVLWERVAPDGLERARWDWTDARLERLRALGVTPILGLMHHGSGPRYTSLLDPEFPRKFAEYARACAHRYPWLEWVTPINEPLTTARFSGLYGHWYPHRSNDSAFVRMLLNECEGIRMAMREIRAVNPHARLIQTEDLGHTHSTPLLAYQAAFETDRRWLTFDLLCGRVTPDHSLYRYLRRSGASPGELHSFVDDPCAPDVLGVDYYVTGERYLDEELESYAACSHGGNNGHAYADVDVARAQPAERRGLYSLLMETWDRYGIPIAVTEAYLSCDDANEQLRWLDEGWHAAQAARDDGCDVRAVTAWALLGTCGWDELVTRPGGRYDAGAFDVQSGAQDNGESAIPREIPRETPIAEMIRALARHGWYEHEALGQPGWWQQEAVAAGAV